MRTVAAIVVALLLVAPACRASEQRPAPVEESRGGLQVTYIGNEGFLISGGGKKVLIDALYREGVRGYVVVPPERRKKTENAQPPFDNVDLILATHYHADHFDPGAVGTHLLNNPKGIFVSTNQAVDQLEMEFADFSKIKERVKAITPKEGERTKITPNSIKKAIVIE